MKKGKFSIRYNLNKKVKPQTLKLSDDEKQSILKEGGSPELIEILEGPIYPIYVKVIARQQNTLFRSKLCDQYVSEPFFKELVAPQNSEIIKDPVFTKVSELLKSEKQIIEFLLENTLIFENPFFYLGNFSKAYTMLITSSLPLFNLWFKEDLLTHVQHTPLADLLEFREYLLSEEIPLERLIMMLKSIYTAYNDEKNIKMLLNKEFEYTDILETLFYKVTSNIEANENTNFKIDQTSLYSIISDQIMFQKIIDAEDLNQRKIMLVLREGFTKVIKTMSLHPDNNGVLLDHPLSSIDDTRSYWLFQDYLDKVLSYFDSNFIRNH